MTKKTSLLLTFITLIAIANSFVFIIFFHYSKTLTADSLVYDQVAWNFAQGRGLVDNDQSFIPRPTTYHVFLGLIYCWVGHSPFVVLIFQSFLYAATCLLLYFSARKIAGKPVALLASFFLSVYFPAAYYASGILTETLAVFLTAAAFFFWIRYVVDSHRIADLILCGIFLALDFLCRPIVFFLPFIFLIHYELLSVKPRKASFTAATLLLSICLVVTSWTLWNYRTIYGLVHNYVDVLSGHFLASTLEHKYSLWDWNHLAYMAADDARNREKEAIKQKVSEEQKKDPSISTRKVYFREAFAIIRQDPLRYAQACLIRIPRLWISYPTLSSLKGKVAIVSFDLILLILAVIGLIHSRHEWKILSIFWLPLLSITLTHLFLHVEPRYSASMKPYLMVFSSYGFIVACRFVAALLQKRRQT